MYTGTFRGMLYFREASTPKKDTMVNPMDHLEKITSHVQYTSLMEEAPRQKKTHY